MPTYNAVKALPGDEAGPWGTHLPKTYDVRDVLLYAVGIGIDDLRFVYEGHADFAVFPTFPIRWGFEGLDVDPELIPFTPGPLSIDAERYLEVIRPLPTEGTVQVRSRLLSVHPKGKGNAFIECESQVVDADGDIYLRMVTGAFMRGIKTLGDIEPFEGAGKVYSNPIEMPQRPPDNRIDTRIAANQAHVYRLSGDYNPLHIDPDAARFGGFDQPILHGLCTFGHCAYRLLGELGDGEASRFKKIQVRFTAPMLLDAPLQIRTWNDGEGRVIFDAVTDDQVVISNAYFEYR
ncbi:MAG: MaoC/PaaZ C-terminal domain-containing protein [Pseudomonadota bacterium]